MNVKLSVVFALACTLFRSAQGIIGAHPVKVGDFSYSVRISYTISFNTQYISGSIIHKRFIVTSAITLIEVAWNEDKSAIKSVELKKWREMVVTVLPNVNSESQKNEITEKVKRFHLPQKNLDSNQFLGGIAILELQNDLNLSGGNIHILKLPTANLNYMEDYEKFAVFTGFGPHHLKNHTLFALRSMEVKIVDCPKEWLDASGWGTFCGNAIILHKNINISQNQSLGTWAGDTGGPLVYRKNTLIGILQYVTDGDERLGQKPPARFTNVSHYLDCINDVIAGIPSAHIVSRKIIQKTALLLGLKSPL